MKEIFLIIAVVLFLALGSSTTLGSRTPSARRELDSQSEANTVAVFPLTIAHDICTMEFKINGNSISVVPDTGSQYLIIAGKSCEACQGRGSITTGSYDETGTNTKIQDESDYGSQQDHITWYIDDIDVDGLTDPLNVEFGSITKVTGSTSENILGLQNKLKVSDRNPFVNQLMFSQQVIAPAFVFDMSSADNALLRLGSQSMGQTGNSTKLIDVPTASSILGETVYFPFYYIMVNQITVGGNPIDSPKLCMLDSGSGALFCAKSLADQIGAGQGFEIEFENFTLSYGSDMAQYVVEQPDLNENQFILGLPFWMGRIWSFDLRENQLTVTIPDPSRM